MRRDGPESFTWVMTNGGWEFWQVTPRDASGGAIRLATTRPGGRVAVDRRKLWALVPNRMIFLANWHLTKDYWREDDANGWEYENIDIDDARSVALEAPDLSTEEIVRMTHPERCLTLDQTDRHTVEKILGKRTADRLSSRR